MKISTIIPAYNAAKFIRQSVTSALAQQGVDHEVIVVDDGSLDGTWEALAPFGSAIRKVRQANAGPSPSRNHGARLATGEWLAFLDADDEWLPNKLARQLALADAQTGMVYTDILNFGHCPHVTERFSDIVPLWEGDIFERLLVGNFVPTSSVMIRKDWFDRLGGFDESLRVCEDWDLWLRYAGQGGVVRLVREPLSRYRWHQTSASRNHERMLNGRLQVIKRALAMPRTRNVPRGVLTQAVANAWMASAWMAAEHDQRKAIHWYLRSVSLWPWNFQVYKEIVKCCLELMWSGSVSMRAA